MRVECATWNSNLNVHSAQYSIKHTYIFISNISIFFICRYSFERWPEILVIHMKRFAPTGSYRAKLTSNIQTPLRNLDLRYLLKVASVWNKSLILWMLAPLGFIFVEITWLNIFETKIILRKFLLKKVTKMKLCSRKHNFFEK